MRCFLWLAVVSLFPEVIAADNARTPENPRSKVQCEHGVCRLVHAEEPTSTATEPKLVAPLPQASVDTRPQHSVLITPVKPTRRGLLKSMFRRR